MTGCKPCIIDTLNWLHRAERMSGGISAWEIDGQYEKSYPEVTGYLIPTLIKCDAIPLAKRCAEWLRDTQNQDGSWCGLDDDIHHTFDTAAIIEGLTAWHKYSRDDSYISAIRCGLDYIEAQRLPSGLYRRSPYQNDSNIYCLRINGITGFKPSYFNLFDGMTRSHYVAYALDGLWELGYTDIVRKVLSIIPKDGLIPYWIGPQGQGDGADICATCQIAILLEWAGIDNSNQVDASREWVQENGGIPQSPIDHRQISWGAKFYLDMELTIA